MKTIRELEHWGDLKATWDLPEAALMRVAQSHERLLQTLARAAQPIYGIHTHFGHNSGEDSAPEAWLSHQMALLQYLQVGAGQALPDTVVRRALRLQAYKIGLGYSGVHPDTFARLLALADQDRMPEVPCHGSLGASGDLIPMAHALEPLFSDQEAKGPRDVLALVNTNAMMASLAVACWTKVRRLADVANCGWLVHSEALGWACADFERQARGWQARATSSPERQAWIGRMRGWHAHLSSAGRKHVEPPPSVQARYSLRCAPQVLVDIEENLTFAAGKITEEALGLADNPVVLDDGIWHGGLFYTAGLSTAAELMQNAVVRLGDLMDRQILLAVTPEHSHGLPTNLQAGAAGDHVKGLHQLVSALQQKIKGMSLPACLLSFSCESNNQDIVPASMAALLAVHDSLQLLEEMARVHAMVGERAWALRHGNLSALPPHLSLKAWPDYSYDALLKRFHDATSDQGKAKNPGAKISELQP